MGFEPTEPFGSSVFKTDAIDRSATSPKAQGRLAGPSKFWSVNVNPDFRSFKKKFFPVALKWQTGIETVLPIPMQPENCRG